MLTAVCHRLLLAGALALAALALTHQPASAQQCVIKCEKCVCNLRTGVCECTNCTLQGCTIGGEGDI